MTSLLFHRSLKVVLLMFQAPVDGENLQLQSLWSQLVVLTPWSLWSQLGGRGMGLWSQLDRACGPNMPILACGPNLAGLVFLLPIGFSYP